MQLPNHLFRILVIQNWHWPFLPSIVANLIIFLLLVAETMSASYHLRLILNKIYQTAAANKSGNKCP